jgi:hypothetical protein
VHSRVVCLIVGAFITVSETTAPASDVVDVAARLIGRPYVWGAEGPTAFDCSGLTQYVFREFAVELPRRAVSQSRAGDPAGRRLQRGDLVFFSSDTRKTLVTHVGIYEGRGRMIEASKSAGLVRRSSLDDSYWVERFMFARRLIADGNGPREARERAGRGDDDRATGPTRKGAIRGVAVRALEELAGALLRHPRR